MIFPQASGIPSGVKEIEKGKSGTVMVAADLLMELEAAGEASHKKRQRQRHTEGETETETHKYRQS